MYGYRGSVKPTGRNNDHLRSVAVYILIRTTIQAKTMMMTFETLVEEFILIIVESKAIIPFISC